jgi:hypothetical protein
VGQCERLETHGRFVLSRRWWGFARNQHEGMHRIVGKGNRLGFDCGLELERVSLNAFGREMKGIRTEKLEIGEIDAQPRVPIRTRLRMAKEETSEEAMTDGAEIIFECGTDDGTHFL